MQPQSNRGLSRGGNEVSFFVQAYLQGLPHQHRGMAWTHPLRFWCFRALQAASLLALASLMVIAWAAVMSAAEVLRWALVTAAFIATFDLIVVRKFTAPPA